MRDRMTIAMVEQQLKALETNAVANWFWNLMSKSLGETLYAQREAHDQLKVFLEGLPNRHTNRNLSSSEFHGFMKTLCLRPNLIKIEPDLLFKEAMGVDRITAFYALNKARANDDLNFNAVMRYLLPNGNHACLSGALIILTPCKKELREAVIGRVVQHEDAMMAASVVVELSTLRAGKMAIPANIDFILRQEAPETSLRLIMMLHDAGLDTAEILPAIQCSTMTAFCAFTLLNRCTEMSKDNCLKVIGQNDPVAATRQIAKACDDAANAELQAAKDDLAREKRAQYFDKQSILFPTGNGESAVVVESKPEDQVSMKIK